MFLKTAAGALTAAPGVAGMAQSEKIKAGLIGCGWYGMVDLQAAFAAGGVECVALCDVDTEHLEQSAAEVGKLQGAKPRTFKDYRELLDIPGLQAVFIGTPPHWHALQFIAACEKGLDIYCEKPLAYDIREGRAMVSAANKAGNIVQIGFQRRKTASFRAVREYIQAGRAGRIVQVDVNIHYGAQMLDSTPQDPPASLDWETWCGPAPKLPYSPNIGHKAWRLEAAYGNGHLVDWGIHLIDADPRRPGREDAEVRNRGGRALRVQRPDHDARHAHGSFRIRAVPGRLASPALGRRGVRPLDHQRDFLLWREGNDLRQRQPLGDYPSHQWGREESH